VTASSANAARPFFSEPVGVMWKTVSEDCNLACDYCYYSTCGGKPGKKIDRIDDRLLETFIQSYMDMNGGVASFAWQGGEPLLAGLDFFEKVVALQARHAPPNTVISNALQTNGTLITDRWAAFFSRYRFLVGVSLDGPREIHDLRRRDAAGKGSFDRVMRGIDCLRRHGVDFNILTVVHKGNVGKAKELFEFYERENFAFVQFIPCMKFHSQRTDEPGIFEITPQEYGDFLCEAFDCWYNGGEPVISERFFDNLLSVYAHREDELCIHRGRCPKTVILERNGDAYPCDFLIHPDWKLGNVGTDSLADILANPQYERFSRMKPELAPQCRECRWLSLCHGGCPRNRSWESGFVASGASGPDYFCQSYRRFFAYAHERMTELADKVRARLFRQGVLARCNGKPPGRNDPCACGSGRKFKNCCIGLRL